MTTQAHAKRGLTITVQSIRMVIALPCFEFESVLGEQGFAGRFIWRKLK
jgi:hypothetical protein